MSTIYNAYTNKPISRSGLYTETKSYEMLPDNSLIKCQFIDNYGNYVKRDYTKGTDIVENVRVMDQRIFYDDILYCVEYPINSGKIYHTRASLISLD